MNSTENERLWVQHSSFTRAYLDQLSRRLRDLGILPRGGRGLNAPDISEHEATAAAVTYATDAPRMTTTYLALEATWSGIGPKSDAVPYDGCQTFGEAMVRILKRPGAHGVAEVCVYRDWPRAVIRMGDGRTYHYGLTGYAEAAAMGFRAVPSALVFHIAESTLDAIGTEMQHPTAGGWVRQ